MYRFKCVVPLFLSQKTFFQYIRRKFKVALKFNFCMPLLSVKAVVINLFFTIPKKRISIP